MNFVKNDIYEASYIVRNVELGTQIENTMFIQADNFEEAKLHLLEAVENDTYHIIDWEITPKTLWKKKDEGVPSSDLMPVICLDSSLNPLKGGIKGEKYFVQRSSIYMDPDGTAYGYLFEDNQGKIFMANVRLDRFMSI